MIIFLYGADSFHSQEKLHSLKEQFSKKLDTGENSITMIDGFKVDLKGLSERINTGSLFIKKRLVIINDIFSNKKKIHKELIDLLKPYSKNSDISIIIRDEDLSNKNIKLSTDAKKLFTFLKKQEFVQEFKSLNNNQLLTFIKTTVNKYKKDIKLPAASFLLNNNNNDLWHLSKEIKKISFGTKEKEITIEDIKTLGSGSFNENIFALIDSISNKNKTLFIKLLEEQLLAGLNMEYILTMMIRQFKIMWQIKTALQENNNEMIIAKKLHLHPFIVKKGIQQSKNFDIENIKNYFNQLVELDYLNKNGLTDLKTKLILLVSEF